MSGTLGKKEGWDANGLPQKTSLDISARLRLSWTKGFQSRTAVGNWASVNKPIIGGNGSRGLEDNHGESKENTKLVDLEEEGWLGEEELNPHNQNQNLTSYP